MERINTYENWLKQEGLPVITDWSIPDVMEVPLAPWERKGGLGVHVNLRGAEGVIDAYLCEIPPGQSLKSQRHFFDEVIYILSGYGATSVWVDDGSPKQTFEWQPGSFFCPPLNTWHQHFNGQSDKPVRYLGITKAPMFMNLFHDIDYVFNNDYIFRSRFSGEEGFFSSEGKLIVTDDFYANPKIWDSAFIPDCKTFQLVDDPKRGGLSSNAAFEMANGIISAHISDFPGGTYLKAHHHGPGAHFIVLSGEGYELLWPLSSGIMAEGFERIKIPLTKGSLFSPPSAYFHQHFSTGLEPMRVLAVHGTRSLRYEMNKEEVTWGRKSIKEGGRQVEYADEDPAIRRMFKEELAKTGAAFRMSKFFPGE